MNTNEILTSTGSLGVERRSHDRLYVTPYEPLEYESDIMHLYDRVTRAVNSHSRISRGVLRVVAYEDEIANLAEDGIRPEAVVHLDAYDQPESVLVYYGFNKNERAQTLVPREEIIVQTQNETEAIEQTSDIDLGDLEIYDCLHASQYESLHALWGGTFGWTQEQIGAFARRTMREKSVRGVHRTVWFAGLAGRAADRSPDDIIVSAAMAERISIPGFSNTIQLVESTEWRTNADRSIVRPSGSIVPVLQNLHAQVLRDIPNAALIAECNFTTRADRRGHQAGLVIPPRVLADQILVQNVGVNDGHNNWPLRDFILMQLLTVRASALRQARGDAC